MLGLRNWLINEKGEFYETNEANNLCIFDIDDFLGVMPEIRVNAVGTDLGNMIVRAEAIVWPPIYVLDIARSFQ